MNDNNYLTNAYPSDSVILTPSEMVLAEKLTYANGIAPMTLMANAGKAVSDFIARAYPSVSNILVVCGPGNNGGDGFIAATNLANKGYAVSVALFGQRLALKGEAAQASRQWNGECLNACPGQINQWLNKVGGDGLIIDAIFGTGLTRGVTGKIGALLDEINDSGVTVVAVDLPSGVDGASGLAHASAVKASDTVTFCRMKPGHVLFPGRKLSGQVHVADIAIPDTIITKTNPRQWLNCPSIWHPQAIRPGLDGHKYNRGYVVVLSGELPYTGAARLAARGALRAGAGMVVIASPLSALNAHACQLNAIMLTQTDTLEDFNRLLSDPRKNAVVIGPALGVGEYTCQLVETALNQANNSAKTVVIDADALTSFADNPNRLFKAIPAVSHKSSSAKTIITPHEGEFTRIFPGLTRTLKNYGKLVACREAAIKSGAIVCFKGADTVICAPNGCALINNNAPAPLASAGSGDVLAGMIGAVAAQGMTPLEACAAGVWLHGEAANKIGQGLIAEDIPEALPQVLTQLFDKFR